MEYRVGLGWKNMKKWEKTTIYGHSRRPVPVQVIAVSVHVMLCFFVLTSFRILTITCSFLIRFE